MNKFTKNRIYKCCKEFEAIKAEYIELECTLRFKTHKKLFNGVYISIYTKEGSDGYYEYIPYFETYVTSVRQLKAFFRKHKEFIKG